MTLARMVFLVLLSTAICESQTPQQPPTSQLPAAQEMQRHEPVMTLLRKTVVFIEMKCRKDDKEYDSRGTGFVVAYPEPSIGGGAQFNYLVTNRHVALCWDESEAPMVVESVTVRLNRRSGAGEDVAEDLALSLGGNLPWLLPTDDSVDLAILPFALDPNIYDYTPIPTTMFAGKNLLNERLIREGEPVFFVGFFYQFPGVTRMEPIVRQGIIAMLPHDKVPFVNARENLYLADMHVFGGNSGSPAFISLNGVHDGKVTGDDFAYRLLGVVNGYVSEDQNFNLELSTTVTGTQKANSGISTIVPVDDLEALLDDPRLKALRDSAIAAYQLKK